MTTTELAAEEHAQGLPLTDGHCDDCEHVTVAAYKEHTRRECTHDDTVEITSLDGRARAYVCRCGLTWPPKGKPA